MIEFMVHVERIVRPIQAMDDRKDRMREELLAHLTATYEVEVARQGDAVLARSRAIASLGEPERLRQELQETVSRGGRWKAQFERLFNWHAPEPAWKYTLRAGVFSGLSILLLLPLVLLSSLRFGAQPALEALRLLVPLAALIGVNVFVLGYLYFKMRDALLGAPWTKRSWARVGGCVLASSLTVEASLLFFLWNVSGDIESDLGLFAARSLICLALPLIGVWVAWSRGPQEIRHAMWECLEISG
jgi:hypothetical protein